MTEDTLPAAEPAETSPAPAEPVVIPGTTATPPVSISAAEHQLLADLKAEGHDLVVLFEAVKAKI